MLRTNQNIALLLFTRTPEEEVRYKSLLPQQTPNRQKAIIAKLIRESQQVLEKTGLPTFIYSSADQVGTTFAEKLYAAFAAIFERGYDGVIVIGNDCPQLQPNDILRAAAGLEPQGVVVGPDKSGGVYLFGLTRTVFGSCSSFANIRWSTSQVLTDLAAQFGLSPATLALLPTYSDINNARDLQYALHQKLFRPAILLFLKYLLNRLISFAGLWREYFVLPVQYTHQLFRGPPVCL